jgi:hypothetical protein
MSDRKQALIEQRDKVKAGFEQPTNWRDFIALVDNNAGPTTDDRVVWAHRAYHGSLDAAKALHEAVLPGWVWLIDCDEAEVKPSWETTDGYDAEIEGHPARAWLLAIHEALIAGEDRG